MTQGPGMIKLDVTPKIYTHAMQYGSLPLVEFEKEKLAISIYLVTKCPAPPRSPQESGSASLRMNNTERPWAQKMFKMFKVYGRRKTTDET